MKHECRAPLHCPEPAEGSQLDIWQRLCRILVVMIFLGVLGVVGTKFWPEIERLREIEDGNAKLEAQVAMLRDERDAVKQEYTWLRDDPGYLESVARDKLNKQKDGETIIRIKRPEEGR